MENHKQTDICFGAHFSVFLADMYRGPAVYQALTQVWGIQR